MNSRLTGQVVLITGASSGIGEACANQFASQGAKLILCARREEKLKELAKQLRLKHQSTILVQPLDVSDQKQVEQLLTQLPHEWQQIDILINNAGLAAGQEKAFEADLADWNAMVDINFKGLMYLTRAVLPIMVKRNQGHVVNIGSISGHQTYVGGSVYCATKHAVRAFSQGLKLDLTGTDVRVSSVDPGMVETEFSQVRFKGDQQKAEQVYQGLKPLHPNDIADAVFYCVSRPAHVNISEVILMPTAQSSVSEISREK